jgi:uncharacterized protein (DUF1778 family)
MSDAKVPIQIRAQRSDRDIIDRAAALEGKTRSDFMMECARQRALDVLLDRRLFSLDDKQWQEFEKELDRSPDDNPKLMKMLTTPPPWSDNSP